MLNDAGDMSIRKHEFGLLEDLLNRVVTAHTAVNIWLSMDNICSKNVGAADVARTASHIVQLGDGYLGA